MYCRNCGKDIDDKAVVCVGCGVPPLKGEAYCQGCGKEVPAGAEVCASCGVALLKKSAASDDKTWAMLAHLSLIFLGFIGPLIVWLVKGKESEFVNEESKEALNFGITLGIGWAIAFVLSFVWIGFLLYPVLGICSLVFPILACVQANNGNSYRYPAILRLVK